MSDGLTGMQRDILATLDAAKAAAAGAANGSGRLADDVYDLRASVRYLSPRGSGDRLSSCGDGPLPTPVSRAVRGLIHRGHLIPSTASGRDDWDAVRRPQARCRFVRRAQRSAD